jgi:hypothetical protein
MSGFVVAAGWATAPPTITGRRRPDRWIKEGAWLWMGNRGPTIGNAPYNMRHRGLFPFFDYNCASE